MRSCDCSSSVCGIKGAENALAVSITPWKRSFFVAGSSISASEAGRLNRSSRSEARLLRFEIIDNTDQTANTKAANTTSGITSATPTNAKITLCLPEVRHIAVVLPPLRAAPANPILLLFPSANCHPKLEPRLNFNVHDLANDQGANNLGNNGK